MLRPPPSLTMNQKLVLAFAGAAAVAALFLSPVCQAAEWADQAFPELSGYKMQLQSPKIEGTKELSRSAIYAGKKKVKVTVACSERFGKMVASKQLPKNAKEARLKGHRCWILQGKKGMQLMVSVKNQQLLLLAGDSTCKPKDLLDIANRFDLNKLQQTLALSPDGENSELKLYTELKPGWRMSQVLVLLGPPDHDLGEGDFKLIYELQDGSKVQIGGKTQLKYVHHVLADGSTVNLL